MKKRFIVVILAVVILLSLLTGCSDSSSFWDEARKSLLGQTDEEFLANNEDHDVALVIIAGRHANANMYPESILRDNLLDLIDQSVEYYIRNDEYYYKVNTHVVVSDGKPTSTDLYDDNGDMIHMRSGSDSAERTIALTKTVSNQVIEALMGEYLRADDDEVDLAAALMEATAILDQYDDKEKYIVVLDTGICTTGHLDMRQIEFDKHDAEVLVKTLSPAAFPKLDGIHVSFYNFGNFGGDQMSIQNNGLLKEKFELFWEEFLAKSGATVNIKFAEQTKNEMLAGNGYPPVSGVIFPTGDDTPIKIPGPNDPYDSKADQLLVYNENTVSFNSGGAEFKDAYTAKRMAENLARYYKEVVTLYPDDCDLYVVGSICQPGPGKEYTTHTDSYNRAYAVKKLLVDAGIPEDKIHIIDAGTTVLPWRDAMEFPNGKKDNDSEINQDKNRVVAIIPSYRTEIVEELRTRLGDRFPY